MKNIIKGKCQNLLGKPYLIKEKIYGSENNVMPPNI